MFRNVRSSIKWGAVSVKLEATKSIKFNKQINIYKLLHVLQGYEKLSAQPAQVDLKEKPSHLEKSQEKNLH